MFHMSILLIAEGEERVFLIYVRDIQVVSEDDVETTYNDCHCYL